MDNVSATCLHDKPVMVVHVGVVYSLWEKSLLEGSLLESCASQAA